MLRAGILLPLLQMPLLLVRGDAIIASGSIVRFGPHACSIKRVRFMVDATFSDRLC